MHLGPLFQDTMQDCLYMKQAGNAGNVVPSLCAVRGCLDASVPCRVKVLAELLRGIHQIKMCVWEQGFVAKVCSPLHHPSTSGKLVQTCQGHLKLGDMTCLQATCVALEKVLRWQQRCSPSLWFLPGSACQDCCAPIPAPCRSTEPARGSSKRLQFASTWMRYASTSGQPPVSYSPLSPLGCECSLPCVLLLQWWLAWITMELTLSMFLVCTISVPGLSNC